VPTFLRARAWEFRGKIDDDQVTATPPEAVKVAVRFNGFYIFHPFETPKLAA
jgi:hypothetical protein